MWTIKGFDHLYIQYIYIYAHTVFGVENESETHVWKKKHFEQSLYIYHVGGK